MRRKELNKLKVIECLINHERLPKTSNGKNEVSFYSIFNINLSDDNTKTQDDIISYKTLGRYIKELTESGIFIYNDGYYSLNKDRFVADNNHKDEIWAKLLNAALESGELEIYLKIKSYLNADVQQNYFSNDELQNYKAAIRDNIMILRGEQNVIKIIRTAISQEQEIEIRYKGSNKAVCPLCIVVSRDGKKHYLYAVRKGKLATPYDLSQVQVMRILGKKQIDREKYLDEIKKMWDIDINKPIPVKVVLRTDCDTDNKAEKELRKYFPAPTQGENDGELIFEGDMGGISDFEAWVRENIKCCAILEPADKLEKLAASLEAKISRYGEINEG